VRRSSETAGAGATGGSVAERAAGAGGRTTRVERAGIPGARSVLMAAAEQYGVCLRLVALRVTDTVTGERQVIDVPCGATRAAVCRPCAERARQLRAVQCREGWHLDHEPRPPVQEPSDRQRALATELVDLRYVRELLDDAGQPLSTVDDHLRESAGELAAEGVRERVPPWSDPAGAGGDDALGGGSVADGRSGRRVRSTRRRADVPDLPRLPVANYTVGRAYGREGRQVRPSMFVTLTLPSYGRVDAHGAAVDTAGYDYRRAARDAIHFGRLVDRWVQNLRRAVGWNVQYFAVVEAQRRGAPHLHLAIRGTIPRALLRQVTAATYHQVWWPPCDSPAYRADRPASWPVWAATAGAEGGYVDAATGELLPTWGEALDTADETGAPPAHLARFGPRLNAQGLLAGQPEAGRLVGYLTKYLTKSLGESYEPATDAGRVHVARLVEALRFEPCSPRCPNWLLHGVQPRHVRAGLRPGVCRGAAHRPANLGYGGRRCLVSRWWSGKTLADHKADRHAFAQAVLAETARDTPQPATPGDNTASAGGGPPTGSVGSRYVWEYARPGSADIPPLAERIGRAVAERARWRRCLTAIRASTPDERETGSGNAR
jgi:Replication initiator protein, pSAM2